MNKIFIKRFFNFINLLKKIHNNNDHKSDVDPKRDPFDNFKFFTLIIKFVMLDIKSKAKQYSTNSTSKMSS